MTTMILNLIGYLVYVSVIVLGFSRKKSSIASFFICVYMWFIIAFNHSTADYYAYEEMFLCSYAPRYAGHEYGFMTICRICLSLGLSFTQFRCVIALLIVLLVYRAIDKYTYRKNVVLALYLIFPFLGSASGLRQACSSAIVLNAINYLLEDKKGNSIKFIVCIGIATLFHYSSVFYLLFILAKYFRVRIVPMLGLCLVVIAMLVVVSKTNILYIVLSRITSRQKTLQWFQVKPYLSPLYIISFALFCAFLFLLHEAKILIRDRETVVGMSVSKTSLKFSSTQVDTISRMIILSLLAFAGAIFNSVVFLRLVQTLIPLGYAVCVDAFVAYSDEDSYRRMCSIQNKHVLVIFCVLVALFVYGYWIGGDTLRIPVGNSLFGG